MVSTQFAQGVRNLA